VRNLITTDGGVIFTDNPTGREDVLKLVSANDGSQQWAIELDGWIDSIVRDENLVYVVGNAGRVLEAYHLWTGDLAWKSKLILPDHSGYNQRLQGSQLQIYSSRERDLIYIIDPSTGDLADTIRISPISQESAALLKLENGDTLQANQTQLMLVRNGTVVWQTNLEGAPQKFPSVVGNMLVVRFKNDRTVFDGLAGLDLATGRLIWQRPAEFLSNFAVANDLLYIVSKEASVFIIDPQTGKTIGEIETLPKTINTFYPISAVAVNDHMLYVYFFDSQELIAFERMAD
jgi:outer membrane protein assembly factor BamB